MHQVTSESRCEWATPRELLEVLEAELGPFDLDPCADATTSAAPTWWGRYDDGLRRPWRAGRVWVNPPWSRAEGLRIEPWLLTAHESTLHGLADLVVVHVPCTPATRWWSDLVAARADEIRLLTSRLRHVRPDGRTGSPRFDSALALYRRGPRRPQRVLTAWDWRAELAELRARRAA